jgi:hypothetical protein
LKTGWGHRSRLPPIDTLAPHQPYHGSRHTAVTVPLGNSRQAQRSPTGLWFQLFAGKAKLPEPCDSEMLHTVTTPIGVLSVCVTHGHRVSTRHFSQIAGRPAPENIFVDYADYPSLLADVWRILSLSCPASRHLFVSQLANSATNVKAGCFGKNAISGGN